MIEPRLRGLTLTVTERCNLRCGYCYVPADGGRTMAPGTIDAAVDLFLRHADRSAEPSLSFFGGEPFLRTDLLRRAIDRARAGFGRRRLRVPTPTNGTLLDAGRLAFCRTHGLELAVSIDGASGGTGERPFAGGGDSAPALLSLLPGILALDPAARITARMTVTPRNVGELSGNVRALAGLGFRRIVFLPAYERPWSDDAVEVWRREHERLGRWLAGASGAGRRVPDLPAWRAVESRLALGRPRRACGAGVRLVAVAADGALYPCYRFVHAAGREEFRLGDVRQGFTNDAALALLAALGPQLARPADGDCAACSARDGCTFYCPALGFWLLRDPLAVPAVACRLERARVEAIRPYTAAAPRRPAAGAARRRIMALAAATAVAGTAVASAACYESYQEQAEVAGDAPADARDARDAPADARDAVDTDAGDDGMIVGVCPVGADGDADVDDVVTPGICAGIC